MNRDRERDRRVGGGICSERWVDTRGGPEFSLKTLFFLFIGQKSINQTHNLALRLIFIFSPLPLSSPICHLLAAVFPKVKLSTNSVGEIREGIGKPKK